MADTPDAIPAFATAARSAILAPMPPLEINATQPWLIEPDGNVAETTRRLAVMNLPCAASKPTSAPSTPTAPSNHLAIA